MMTADPVLLEQIRNARAERDKYRAALKRYAAMVADLGIERDALLSTLQKAQPHVCSLLCPSTWKTAEGRPPHHPICAEMTAAFSQLTSG